MGCIGFPYHPVIEVTSKCSLSCIRCHVGSSSLGVSPPFEDLARLIRGIGQIPEFRMVVFTGGEPLVREDLPELARVAKGVGLPVVIATNATLIDDGTARVLRRSGVVGAAISLDAVDPGLHDRIRGKRGAFGDAGHRGLSEGGHRGPDQHNGHEGERRPHRRGPPLEPP